MEFYYRLLHATSVNAVFSSKKSQTPRSTSSTVTTSPQETATPPSASPTRTVSSTVDMPRTSISKRSFPEVAVAEFSAYPSPVAPRLIASISLITGTTLSCLRTVMALPFVAVPSMVAVRFVSLLDLNSQITGIFPLPRGSTVQQSGNRLAVLTSNGALPVMLARTSALRFQEDELRTICTYFFHIYMYIYHILSGT